MAHKLKHLRSKEACPACCDFSKDSTKKASLLEMIKKEAFYTPGSALQLSDDELTFVNAAAKPKPPKEKGNKHTK